MAVVVIAIPFGLGWLLYQNWSVLAPVTDFSDAVRLWEGKFEKDREMLSGSVVNVSQNYTFSLATDNGNTIRLRLTGIEAPSVRLLGIQRIAGIYAKAEELMIDFALSNRVEVALTFRDENQGGLGVLYVGGTNINALLVSRGLAQMKREYLRGMKLSELYALIRAERAATKKPETD